MNYLTHHRVGGKLAPRRDPRLLRLAHFLDRDLAPPPPALDRSGLVTHWPMYANDRLGDCTIAAAGHMIELWSAMAGKEVTPSQSTIVRVYDKLSPADQGCVEEDVLSYWRHTGIGGHKLFAYAGLDVSNIAHAQLSLQLFGGAYLGIALPLSAQDQVGKVWDVVTTGQGKPGSWGGHAVNLVGYDPVGPTVITWGALQKMTWSFWHAYVDEAYALLTADWAKAPAASGIDYAKLKGALAQVGKVAA
jgi:hypothetical protein